MKQVKLNGTTVLTEYSYENLGRVSGMTRSNSASTTMTYNATSTSWSLAQNPAGTAQDVTLGFSYLPTGQLATRTVSNNAYAYSASALSRAYTRDGLNKYTNVAGTTYSYDGRGNLTSDGSRTFAYDLENKLTTITGSASLSAAYDPLGRLRQTVEGGTTTQFLYDGARLVAEYNGSGTLLRRYVHGRNIDEPLVQYEGAGVTTPTWFHADQLGSIIATTNSAGSATTYTYSPSGEPGGGTWTGPRFRYTGQIALSSNASVRLYYYKARLYDPTLGRFLQTDPIGYQGGLNLYTCAANDPINSTDPLGLQDDPMEKVTVDAEKWHWRVGSTSIGVPAPFVPGQAEETPRTQDIQISSVFLDPNKMNFCSKAVWSKLRDFAKKHSTSRTVFLSGGYTGMSPVLGVSETWTPFLDTQTGAYGYMHSVSAYFLPEGLTGFGLEGGVSVEVGLSNFGPESFAGRGYVLSGGSGWASGTSYYDANFRWLGVSAGAGKSLDFGLSVTTTNTDISYCD